MMHWYHIHSTYKQELNLIRLKLIPHRSDSWGLGSVYSVSAEANLTSISVSKEVLTGVKRERKEATKRQTYSIGYARFEV